MHLIKSTFSLSLLMDFKEELYTYISNVQLLQLSRLYCRHNTSVCALEQIFENKCRILSARGEKRHNEARWGNQKSKTDFITK